MRCLGTEYIENNIESMLNLDKRFLAQEQKITDTKR